MEDSWLMAVDGTGLYVRSAKAAARVGLTAPDGTPTGALTLFVNSLASMVRPVQPQYLLITWDGAHGTKWRKEICPDYKANRAPREHWMKDQREFDAVREFCDAAQIAQWCLADFEGDDLLAAASRLAARDLPAARLFVVSDDNDVLQLAERDRVWLKMFGARGVVSDAETIEMMWGVPPRHMAALRALAGDRSDGIPGVRGIGPAKAAVMLSVTRFEWPPPASLVTDPAEYSRLLAWHDVMTLNPPLKAPEDHDANGVLNIKQTEWKRGNVLPVLERYGCNSMAERAKKGLLW